MLGYRSRPFSALLEALGEVQVDIFEVTLFASRVKIGLNFSLDPFLQKGSSLQVENLFVCLSVCLSSL